MFLGACDNELATKDPDHRSQCAGGFIPVRMQPTGRDDKGAIGDRRGSRSIDVADSGTDFLQQPDGPYENFVTIA